VLSGKKDKNEMIKTNSEAGKVSNTHLLEAENEGNKK